MLRVSTAPVCAALLLLFAAGATGTIAQTTVDNPLGLTPAPVPSPSPTNRFVGPGAHTSTSEPSVTDDQKGSLPACKTTKSNPPESDTVGTVEATVTWQYNDYVGTKGDVDATMLLFPLNIRIQQPDRDLLAYRIVTPPCVRKYAILDGRADGYGKVVIDNIPAGHYHGIIISGKTTRDITAPFSDVERASLSELIDGGMPKPRGMLALQKWFVVFDITVRRNQTTHISHDFGNTYL